MAQRQEKVFLNSEFCYYPMGHNLRGVVEISNQNVLLQVWLPWSTSLFGWKLWYFVERISEHFRPIIPTEVLVCQKSLSNFYRVNPYHSCLCFVSFEGWNSISRVDRSDGKHVESFSQNEFFKDTRQSESLQRHASAQCNCASQFHPSPAVHKTKWNNIGGETGSNPRFSVEYYRWSGMDTVQFEHSSTTSSLYNTHSGPKRQPVYGGTMEPCP